MVEIIESSGLATVTHAVACLAEAQPLLVGTEHVDAAFIDVQLFGSEGDGMSLVRSCVGRTGSPLLVLATAFRKHAVEAFELGIADYVTKPFSRPRVVQCLMRLATKSISSTSSSQLPPGKIAARREKSIVFLSIDDIWCVESADRITYVHCAHGVFDIDLSSAAVESAFAPRFIRVHRNWLVSTSHIRGLERDDGDSTLLVGSGYRPEDPGVRVQVAKDRAQDLRDRLIGSSLGVRRR
ncbi:MAG: response regulator transcription factor [Gammaproteobacteria bacterium]|nr:response regulator transcription factor [Gammaproteobacteria bacterium]